MNVTFDMKKLASSLAKLNKLPKEQRPTSYQDYLQACSKIAGFTGYEAFLAAQGQASAVQAAPRRNLVDARLLTIDTDGKRSSAPCKLDTDSMRVLELDPRHLMPHDLVYDRYVVVDGRCFHFIAANANYPKADPNVMFAVSSIEDLSKALSPVIKVFEGASMFGLWPSISQYGLRGDYFAEMEGLFDDTEEVDLAEELDQITMWFYEGEIAKNEFVECSYSVYQMLFSSFYPGDQPHLLIPTTESEDKVRLYY